MSLLFAHYKLHINVDEFLTDPQGRNRQKVTTIFMFNCTLSLEIGDQDHEKGV